MSVGLSAKSELPTVRRTPAPFVLGVVAAAFVVGGFSLGVHLPNLHNGLIAATFTAVGAFVLGKRPGNREGWLFLATGSAHAVMFFARQYGLSLPAALGSTWVAWIGVWPLALVLVLTTVTFLCFPDGRLPSPRWRFVVTAMVGAGTVLALASALWPVEYPDNALSIAHPLHFGGADTAQRLWNVLGPACYLLFQLAWVVGVMVRMRRARGDELRQLRWFAYAVAMGAVAMAVSLVGFGSPALGLLAVPMVALATGVAIVKYRLYDIDLVINKTLVIGAMAVLITAGYVAVVVGVGRLIGRSTNGDLVLSVVGTALVAIAFEPARRRVQAAADRLVYGRRPSPYEALAQLSSQLRRDSRQPELFFGLASTVAASVGAVEVTLWVGTDDSLLPAATWPPSTSPANDTSTTPRDLASLDDGGRTQVRPIVHQGVVRGVVTLTKPPGEPLTASEDRLLQDLVAQAGLVVDNVGLAVELQQRLRQISEQAAELQAAAKRIVAAQDQARRRIERDLHDGAQQQLVTLALSLQAVAVRVDAAGDDTLTAKVGEARRQLTEALAELRELARGIHPAILTEEGLEPALSFLAERAPIPVHVDVRLDRRIHPDVEAATYFVVSEALTNAAKHSCASSITVTGRLDQGRLSIEVSDNGRGGADAHAGHGLQGMADRLTTLNGRLTVHSPPGAGTRIQAEIPCN